MADVYANLRHTLATFQQTADEELHRVTDDQLHNELNDAAKHAALAVIRIDQIKAAQPQ